MSIPEAKRIEQAGAKVTRLTRELAEQQVFIMQAIRNLAQCRAVVLHGVDYVGLGKNETAREMALAELLSESKLYTELDQNLHDARKREQLMKADLEAARTDLITAKWLVRCRQIAALERRGVEAEYPAPDSSHINPERSFEDGLDTLTDESLDAEIALLFDEEIPF